MKIEGSASGSESGSISQRHGSADPDPHQNVMDPEHRKKLYFFSFLDLQDVHAQGEAVREHSKHPAHKNVNISCIFPFFGGGILNFLDSEPVIN